MFARTRLIEVGRGTAEEPLLLDGIEAPVADHGLQRSRRQPARTSPRSMPNRSIACAA